jgi:hypothetical protein
MRQYYRHKSLSYIMDLFYTGNGALAATATILLKIYLVFSIPAFSNIFILPEESRITPAQASLVIVNEDKEIAVEVRICLVNDSRIVGDLNQSDATSCFTVDIILEHHELQDSVSSFLMLLLLWNLSALEW